MKIYIFCALICCFLGGAALAQEESPKPFIFPLAAPPSASTWIMGQPYGNTTGAYISGANAYSAGQFLHFGIDIAMPCGTPVIAVADGVVHSVDNPSRGSAPHNVLLNFPQHGLSVLYGHLLERSLLLPDQPIRQGDLVGYSGSPDSICTSRPHLHLEVRSLDHRMAYNPVNVIEAPWHSWVGLGVLLRSPFQMDLSSPRRWMSLEDQPDVQFGGARLNAFAQTFPPAWLRGAPASTKPALAYVAPAENWIGRQLGAGGCCFGPWWFDSEHVHVIDGVASVYEIRADGSAAPRLLSAAPPPLYSADGTHEMRYQQDRTVIRRIAGGEEWHILLAGIFPVLSPDNQHFIWQQNGREVWGGSLDAAETRLLWQSSDTLSVRWLDGQRLLLSERDNNRISKLSILNFWDGSAYELGRWYNLRSLTAAPGGESLIFFSAFNADPLLDGAFWLETAPNGQPQKLPWFADYRWRDSESVYYISFDPATDIQRLNFYHLPTGESRALTNPESRPFTIANGDWSVSPDGKRIVFQEAEDDNLWILESQ